MMPSGDRIEYWGDGQNCRIAKVVNGGITKRWVYAGQLSPVAELDSAGNVVSRFAGGYFIKGGATYRLITDHLGSVRMVVNATTGVIVQRLEYDEFGNVTYDSNPDFQPFGYAGGLYDTRTGLVRFGARDYDASVGRWTSKDPIGFESCLNLYAYCNQDPMNWLDPTGLKKRKCYSSETIAGAQAINSINYQSIKENREYGGFIVKNSDGTYSPTEPQKLNAAGGLLGPIPLGTVAMYHTHGGYDPKMDNEIYSYTDRESSELKLKGNGYLGTPNGVIKKLYWKSDDVINLAYPKKGEGEIKCTCQ